ncbi:MAG: hypothetical protein SGJ09_01735 [Phycisphaerae bacterium]|nr:hypothetical protein [Phycisphaerae bacterium]
MERTEESLPPIVPTVARVLVRMIFMQLAVHDAGGTSYVANALQENGEYYEERCNGA